MSPISAGKTDTHGKGYSLFASADTQESKKADINVGKQ